MQNTSKVIWNAGLWVLVILLLGGTQVAHAQSGFGQVWQKYPGNPLLSILGPPGSWNGAPPTYSLGNGHAFWDNSEYKAYHGGNNGQYYSIGLLTSPTLTAGYTYYAGNPVLTPGAPGEWDAGDVGSPMVFNDGGIYKMWYGGADASGIERIGYATSTDGINWTKHASNPVLEPVFGTWEGEGVLDPYVIKEGSIYKMWYTGWITGVSWGIGYATSPDGINWSKSTENPVLEDGAPGSWDRFTRGPVVLFEEGKYLMWYNGATNHTLPQIGQTGFALSDDGIHWAKDSLHNPVLPIGGPGEWDSDLANVFQVVKEDTIYKMVYGGSDLATFFGGGLATLDMSTSIGNIGAGLPATFALHQNYPNPFNPTTNIGFRIADRGFVSLKVYDISGKEVATLVSESLAAGNYEYAWDATGLASGMYFCRITAGNPSAGSEQGFSKVRKMVLMR